MDIEEVADWATELLCLPRNRLSYEGAVERIVADVEGGIPPFECEMRHSRFDDDTADRISVIATSAAPTCSTMEVSEYVTLLLNGAGTVVGAVVEGAPVATVEE